MQKYHQNVQQLGNNFEVSAVAREAFIPGAFLIGRLKRAHKPRVFPLVLGRSGLPMGALPEGSERDPGRANGALMPPSGPKKESLVSELSVALVTIISCLTYGVQTLPSLTPEQYSQLTAVENVALSIFAIDYVYRWVRHGRDVGYVLQPLNIVDLISFFPLLLQISMGDLMGDTQRSGDFAFLRLLRILRLQRFVRDADTFAQLEMVLGVPAGKVRPYQLQLVRVGLSIATLLFVASGLIYEAEHAVNPQIPDAFTALYFGLTTLTTVGFGDIVPITTAGRAVVGASILAGIAVIPAQLASLVDSLVDRTDGDFKNDERTAPVATNERAPCASCGECQHPPGARFCFLCGAPLCED